MVELIQLGGVRGDSPVRAVKAKQCHAMDTWLASKLARFGNGHGKRRDKQPTTPVTKSFFCRFLADTPAKPGKGSTAEAAFPKIMSTAEDD